MIYHFTDKNFKKEILETKGAALVDFYAEWCGPCRALSPIIDELAEEYKDKPMKIGKLDIDEGADTAAKFGVMSVPTVLIFKKGKIVSQFTGMQSKKTLVEAIEKALT